MCIRDSKHADRGRAYEGAYRVKGASARSLEQRAHDRFQECPEEVQHTIVYEQRHEECAQRQDPYAVRDDAEMCIRDRFELGSGQPLKTNLTWDIAAGGGILSMLSIAFWLFVGLEFVCPLAEEVKEPQRFIPIAMISGIAVSYTHLDVYKRQSLFLSRL